MAETQLILLVEDEAILAMTEAMLLRKAGYEVECAGSGEEAIALVRAAPGRVALILMDINLGPGLDGTQAAQEILKEHDIPIIFLSAHTEPEIVAKTEKITSYGYVVKNSGGTVLAASIKMAFKLHAANQALRSNNEKLRLALEASHAGTFEWDLAHNTHAWSPEFLRIFGLPPEAAGSLDAWASVVHPEDYETAVRKIDEAVAQQTDLAHEYRIVLPGGEVRWIRVTGKTFSENGRPLRLLGLCEDITERKQAERALAHSHDLMRYVIEHNRSAIAIHDRELRYIYVSQRYLDDYKVKEKDIIGRHHYDVFPDLPEKWRIVHQKALAGEICSAEDDPYLREDGTLEWTRWECRPWYEADGSIGGIIVYTEVTSERRRIEDTLKKSQARLLEAQRLAGLGDWEWDRKTDRYTWSKGLYALVGLDENQPVPGYEMLQQYYTPESWQRLDAAVWQTQQLGAPYQIELEMIRADGTHRWLLSRGEAILNDSGPSRAGQSTASGAVGRVSGLRGTVLDITEHKQAEAALQRRNAELAALNQLGQALSILRRPDQILELISAEIGQVLDNRNLTIALYDPATQQVSFPVSRIQGEHFARGPHPLDSCPTDYVIRTGAPLLIRRDMAETLRQNEIVPIFHIPRSLIAVPMRAGGQVTGVIALQDYEHEDAYDEHHVELLTTIAAQAVNALENARLYGAAQQELEERRRAEEALLESEERFRSIIEQSADGVILIDDQGEIMEWNQALADITGIPRETATRMTLCEIQFQCMPPEMRLGQDYETAKAGMAAALRASIDSPAVRFSEFELQAANGERRTIKQTSFPIKTGSARRIGGIVRDVTAQKQAQEALTRSLHEKELLMHELQHRVKNSLMVAASLLSLEEDNLPDERARAIFADTRSRLYSMSAVYEQLCSRAGIDYVDLRQYIQNLVEALSHSYILHAGQVRIEAQVEAVQLNLHKTLLLGIIVNELVTNAIKHAFPAGCSLPGGAGIIRVALSQNDGQVRLCVSDNGVGVDILTVPTQPAGFGWGLGLELVKMLTRQIGGHFTIGGSRGECRDECNGDSQGCTACVTFERE